MRRPVALGSTRVLLKGFALLLCVVLLVLLHTEEKNELIGGISHEGDCLSIEKGGLSRDKSMEIKEFNPLSSKRRVPRGPDPIHNRRSGNGQKPPGEP